MFIDIVMNVGITIYAPEQTTDSESFEKARQHCRTTRRRLVHDDGSTAHEGLSESQSGALLRQTTVQG